MQLFSKLGYINYNLSKFYRLFILIILTLLISSLIHAKNFYLDKNAAIKEETFSITNANYYIDGKDGNDSNDGKSPQTAWRSLAKINNNNSFPAGTIIAIRDSIRYEGGIYFTANGTPGNPITITNWYGSASNRKPVIKASNSVSTWTNVSGNIWRASYTPSTGQVNQVWFEGNQDDPTKTIWGIIETARANLTSDYEYYWTPNVLYVYSTSDPDTRFQYVEADCQTAWNKTYSIFEQGNYVTIENLDIRYANSGGIRIGNNGSNNVIIQDCKTSFTGLRTSESAHGIICYNGNNIIIRRNESFQNSNHGIYAFANNANGTSKYIYIDSNIVYDNKHSQIDINTNGGHLDSVVCRYNTLSNTIGNWVYTDYGATPDGFFVAGQFSGSTKRVYLISNLIVNIYGGAMDINNSNINSLYIYNNTIYSNITGSSDTKQLVYMENGGNTVNFRNNILYSTGTKGLIDISSISNKKLDHNLYYWDASVSTPFYLNSGIKTFSAWKISTGQESNSYNSNPNFVNPINDFRINSPSNAIDNGANISVSNIAIDGTSRPQGSNFDIGAYEYTNKNFTIGVNVNLKVILSGPFNNGSMRTQLDDKGFLPLSQPYNTPPWNYNGTERVSKLPSNIVDWVLLEIRRETSASSVVARRAALLKSNGMIVDLDGTSPVLFTSVESGSYYIVVMHRNHIEVMSAGKVSLSSNALLYDFTNSESKAYGSNSMEDLGNGTYGLYSGDGNGDGSISQTDIINVWLPQFLNSKDGYQAGDFNLDGSVTASDNNIYWLNNNGQTTQVPK